MCVGVTGEPVLLIRGEQSAQSSHLIELFLFEGEKAFVGALIQLSESISFISDRLTYD